MARRPCESTCAEGTSHGVCGRCLPKLVRDMGQTMEEFLDEFAMPILVVQQDRRIRGGNQAAQRLFGTTLAEMGGRLGGELIGCIHAREPGGCGGTVHCQSCAIRATIHFTQETGRACFNVPTYSDARQIDGSLGADFYISTIFAERWSC